jgi:hypothetical protein
VTNVVWLEGFLHLLPRYQDEDRPVFRVGHWTQPKQLSVIWQQLLYFLFDPHEIDYGQIVCVPQDARSTEEMESWKTNGARLWRFDFSITLNQVLTEALLY